MRAVRCKSQGGWSHKLYVKPETFGEKVALWLRGYRVLHEGPVAGKFMVKRQHENKLSSEMSRQ